MSEHEEPIVEIDRSDRYGGHAAAAVCLVHPHLRLIDVYRRRTEKLEKEPTPEMLWGRTVEPALLDFAAEHLLEWSVVRWEEPQLFDSHPLMRAHPDGTLLSGGKYDAGLVSAKFVGYHRAKYWGRSMTDKVPDYANCQEQTYMGLLGKSVSYVVASVGGRAPELWAVPYNDRIFDIAMSRIEAFEKKHVEPRVPPDPDGSDAYRRYIAENVKMKRPELIKVASEDEVHALLMEYRDHRLLAERCADEAEVLEQRVRVAIGEDAGFLLPNDEKITYRADRNGKRALRVPPSFRYGTGEE